MGRRWWSEARAALAKHRESTEFIQIRRPASSPLSGAITHHLCVDALLG